ncbi:hypothetical protein AAVH_18956 [Aphelenchoides avenae]|nr:hypothetical protein AAVH_18956 [Aphelenchus avenae]
MKRHVKTHEEKAYECDECGRNVSNDLISCAECEELMKTHLDNNRSDCATPTPTGNPLAELAKEQTLSITTSRAESLINGLPGRNEDDSQSDEGFQVSVEDLSARLLKLQPVNRSSPFYDHMEKGILDAITEAWKRVRDTGTAGEMISFGLDAYALAAKYNPPSSK